MKHGNPNRKPGSEMDLEKICNVKESEEVFARLKNVPGLAEKLAILLPKILDLIGDTGNVSISSAVSYDGIVICINHNGTTEEALEDYDKVIDSEWWDSDEHIVLTCRGTNKGWKCRYYE